MSVRQTSGLRTIAGLALAVVVAPVGTAFCIEVAMLSTQGLGAGGLPDEIGGFVTFLVLALVFGSVLAALPGLVFGGLAIAMARLIGTRSPGFYAAAGLLAGTFMAWVDTGRTHGAFVWSGAIPFMIGGSLSALTYWAVAER